ncbi:zinc finger protein 479-like [Seriola aureovittata]|uniref:zinc finger protein 479-like n=1 Tax=Seriola aureovittata TaxID=2871759 RepID=UPI0024BE57F8|nr:zinc finger protein 479-like [Seriola aureovittata]
MGTLQHLNAFICERLTAAAVEIFGAVEKTLTEHQEEIGRSKQEIDHLRSLLLRHEVRLHRSEAHQVCDKEASPELMKREGDKEPHSHLYRILTVEQRADIKAEPDADEFITSAPTREAEVPSGRNPESSGLRRETLKDPLEITHHEQDGPDEQQYTEQDWSLCQDHDDPDPPQIKVEKFTPSSPRGETDHEYELYLQSEKSDYDEPRSCSLTHGQIMSNKTFHKAEEQRRDADGKGCKLFRLTRASQPFYFLNHCEYGQNRDGVVNGEWIKALVPTETRKKRKNSILCSEDGESIGVEEDVNNLTRERRHTCPMCAKRFKESSHLKDHVRIHTGEKPYQCKECGVNFRQRGALTLHMRIHTGERPYQCSDCGRRFNRKGDMETHMVTHTGERPHLCMVCGKSFKRKSNLNTHLKIHVEDKMDYTPPL